MKIHIFGPSGSGVTTLGKALATEKTPYFDVDDYYWKQTEIPFSEKSPIPVRQQQILNDVAPFSHWILGGSLISWGDFIKNDFDLVVYLYVPQDIRIARLKKREYERYGDKIHTDTSMKKKFADFIAWAKLYEDDTIRGRSRKNHLQWLETLKCQVIKIEGDTTTVERSTAVKNQMKVQKSYFFSCL